MKTLLLLFILAAPAYGQLPELGLKTEYDRFTDTTTTTMTGSLVPDRPGFVLFQVIGVVKGETINTAPLETTIAILSKTDRWYFLKSSRTLRVIQDGKRYVLGTMSLENSDVTTDGVIEQLVLTVPFSAIRKLSNAEKLEIQVGLYEAEINQPTIDALKRWVSQFP